MINWLRINAGTILICLVLATAVALIVRKLIREKREGKSSCGCDCGNCAMRGKCH